MTAVRPMARSSLGPVRAVVSDVDGTLVAPDKTLSEGTKRAVAELQARGILFTVVSSRPARGLRMLVEPLHLALPMAAFNGGLITTPRLSVLREHVIAPAVATKAIAHLEARGVEVWLFAGDDWLLRDGAGVYVDRERHTVNFEPSVIADFAAFIAGAAKIVGVSKDPALLAQCEGELRVAFGAGATVARSQPYYLDITDVHANKGVAVTALAELIDISPREIAVIGDGLNDVAMFEAAGLSIAMGNASDEVKASAACVTASNKDDGFAKAMAEFVLPHAVGRSVGHAT